LPVYLNITLLQTLTVHELLILMCIWHGICVFSLFSSFDKKVQKVQITPPLYFFNFLPSLMST